MIFWQYLMMMGLRIGKKTNLFHMKIVNSSACWCPGWSLDKIPDIPKQTKTIKNDKKSKNITYPETIVILKCEL